MSHIFFHPDYTVGLGVSPNQPPIGGSRAVPPVGTFTLP